RLVCDVLGLEVPCLVKETTVRRDIPVERGDQTDDLLLSHLHPAPDRVVRRGVSGRGGDQVAAPYQDSRGLWPAEAFASADDDEVGAELDEPGQGVSRRYL